MPPRITLLVVVATLCITWIPQGSVEARTDGWRPIVILAESIKAPSALSTKEREDKAYRLAVLIQRKVGKPAPEKVITALANLMNDSDQVVRFWTAGALGQLGPQAAPAIPALEKALEEARAAEPPGQGRTGIHLDDAIQYALEEDQSTKEMRCGPPNPPLRTTGGSVARSLCDGSGTLTA